MALIGKQFNATTLNLIRNGYMHCREWKKVFKYVHIQNVMKVQYIFTIQYNPFVRYSVPLCTLFWQFYLKPAKPVLFQTFVVAKCFHDVYILNPKNKFSWKVLQFCGVENSFEQMCQDFFLSSSKMQVSHFEFLAYVYFFIGVLVLSFKTWKMLFIIGNNYAQIHLIRYLVWG